MDFVVKRYFIQCILSSVYRIASQFIVSCYTNAIPVPVLQHATVDSRETSAVLCSPILINMNGANKIVIDALFLRESIRHRPLATLGQ